jgi:hypothetical protein
MHPMRQGLRKKKLGCLSLGVAKLLPWATEMVPPPQNRRVPTVEVLFIFQIFFKKVFYF